MSFSWGAERRAAVAPLAAAALFAAGLCALHLLFQADETNTWFLGRPFGAACWFRTHFGIPCPNCGMTRSLILAAHGEFTRAARLSPAGVAVVFTVAATSLLLGRLGLETLLGRSAGMRRARATLRATVLVGAVLTGLAWAGAWGIQLWRAFVRA